MKERSFGWFVAAVLTLSRSVAAQSGDAAGRLGAGAVGVGVMLGDGPSPSGGVRAEGLLRFSRNLGARVDLTRWRTGLMVGCSDEYPRSIRCDLQATSATVGLELSANPARGIVPFAQGGLGAFHRDRHGDLEGRTELAGVLEGGTAFRIAAHWQLRMSAVALWSRDEQFRRIAGDALRFRMLGVSVRRDLFLDASR